MGAVPARRRLGAAAAVAVLLSALATVSAGAAVNDPLLAQQWALAQISAPDAWAVSTGAGVTIGVVDTGVDLGHEDLAAKVAASASCLGAAGDAGACGGSGQDDNGHGTHVSGIAAAATGNGRGMAGVAPDARLVVAKVLSADGTGTSRDVAAGIRWAVDRGARVVNLSLGDILPVSILSSTAFRQAVQEAWSRGAVPVLAAGNSTAATTADYGGLDALVVAATAPGDRRPYYSSSVGNAKWGVAAPGGEGDPVAGGVELDVVSTWWTSGRTNRYATAAGTSMAAPHVSGLVALLLARGLSPAAAVERIVTTTDPVSCGTNCRGRINAARAVAGLSPQPTTAPTTAPRATTTTAPRTGGTSATTSPGASPTTAGPTPPTVAGGASPPPAAPQPPGGAAGGTAASSSGSRARTTTPSGPPAAGSADVPEATPTGEGLPEVIEAPEGALRPGPEVDPNTKPSSSTDDGPPTVLLFLLLGAAAVGGLLARRATAGRR